MTRSIEVRCIEAENSLRHIGLSGKFNEDKLGHITIVDDVVLVSHDAIALWNRSPNSLFIGESVHYEGLVDRLSRPEYQNDIIFDDIPENPGDYALLANIWSRNYYHWFEELSRVCVLEKCGFDGKYVVHIGPTFILESLRMLGIDDDRIVFYNGKNMRFERAWFTARTPVQMLTKRPNLFWDLRSAFISQSSRRPSAKFMLVRELHAYNVRNIINADEVAGFAKRYDYESIDLAAYSFGEQVSLMASGVSALGMHGAGFVNSIFMRRRSSIIEFFSPNYINFTICAISELLSHRYVPLVSYKNGDYEHGENALVDLRLLKIVLENTLI